MQAQLVIDQGDIAKQIMKIGPDWIHCPLWQMYCFFLDALLFVDQIKQNCSQNIDL